MKTMHNYNSSSVAVNDMKRRGFTADFQWHELGLKDPESGKVYRPSELELVEQYRFEGISDPGDMSLVAALEANDGVKGVVIASYGTYGDRQILERLVKVEKSGFL